MTHFLILHFDQPMLMASGGMIIGSNLASTGKASCRLAFHGTFIQQVSLKDQQVKVVRLKRREGVVERLLDHYTLLVVDLFKKESNIQLYHGYPVEVTTPSGVLKGKVLCSFGKSGKVKVELESGMEGETEMKGCVVGMLYKKQLLNKKQNR